MTRSLGRRLVTAVRTSALPAVRQAPHPSESTLVRSRRSRLPHGSETGDVTDRAPVPADEHVDEEPVGSGSGQPGQAGSPRPHRTTQVVRTSVRQGGTTLSHHPSTQQAVTARRRGVLRVPTRSLHTGVPNAPVDAEADVIETYVGAAQNRGVAHPHPMIRALFQGEDMWEGHPVAAYLRLFLEPVRDKGGRLSAKDWPKNNGAPLDQVWKPTALREGQILVRIGWAKGYFLQLVPDGPDGLPAPFGTVSILTTQAADEILIVRVKKTTEPHHTMVSDAAPAQGHRGGAKQVLLSDTLQSFMATYFDVLLHVPRLVLLPAPAPASRPTLLPPPGRRPLLLTAPAGSSSSTPAAKQ